MTSGGDAAGMNPAIRAAVDHARQLGMNPYVVYDGLEGLIDGKIKEATRELTSDMIYRGGTLLRSSRSKRFFDYEFRKQAYEHLKDRNIDKLVIMGGDGSFRALNDFFNDFEVPFAGIPATIDNDIVCTDYTIGYDTAANTAVEAIDRLRDTMQSHERCSVVEVMGRNAGHLALYVGLATGATAVLVPEKPVNFDSDVIDRIRQARLAGNTHFMIIVAEGAGSAIEIGKGIHEELGLDPRVTILGHIQRGGTPSARDRVMASRMGYQAVKVLAEGKTNRVICAQAGQMVDIDITEGLSMKKGLNEQQYEVLQAMTGIDN